MSLWLKEGVLHRPGTVDDMDGQSSPMSAHFQSLQGLDLLPPPGRPNMDRMLLPCRSAPLQPLLLVSRLPVRIFTPLRCVQIAFLCPLT
jgi:hypothetical protein